MSRATSDVVIDLARVPLFKAALVRGVDMGVGRAAVVFEMGAKKAIRGGQGGADGALPGQVWGLRSRPGGFPRSQSGQLRNSITSEREAWAKYLVGTNLAHGKWMEYGSNPRAKNKKYLAIPLNYKAARLQKTAGSAGLRAIPGLEIIARLKNGRGFLLGFKAGRKRVRIDAAKRGAAIKAKGGTTQQIVSGQLTASRKDEPMFVLKKSVRILPRAWLLPTMANTANQRTAAKVLNDTVKAEVRAALAGGKSA